MFPRQLFATPNLNDPLPQATERGDRHLHLGLAPTAMPPQQVFRRLGETLDSLVVDLEPGLPWEALAAAIGLVRGGGWIVLRGYRALASSTAAGRHLLRRLEGLPPIPEALSLRSPGRPPITEQDHVVDQLVDALERGQAVALLADRGRGKSAALGRTAARLGGARLYSLDPEGAEEARRFAQGKAEPVPWERLAEPDPRPLLVDEAARLPVDRLRELARRPGGLALASTVNGYEGSGQGFALRALPAIEQLRPLLRLTLDAPLRWPRGDPAEAWLAEVFALDAERSASLTADTASSHAELRPLPEDEPSLREAYGLLRLAHYRTTPGDLRRLLDSPSEHRLGLWSARGELLGMAWLAAEGALSPPSAEAYAGGQGRLRGQPLADLLITHGGWPEAGTWPLMRSLRTVIHPAVQGRGLGQRLIRGVTERFQTEAALLGTVFGGTPGLLRLRAREGYLPVRLGIRPGERSGEPALTCVRPIRDAAREMVDDLQADLAANLPNLVALAAAEGLAFDPELIGALTDLLPDPAPVKPGRRLAAYLAGACPLEPALAELQAWLGSPPADPLVRGKLFERQSWRDLAGGGSVPAVQRALRRQLLAWAERHPPLAGWPRSADRATERGDTS